MKRDQFLKTISLGAASLPFFNGKKRPYSELIKPKRLKPGDTIGITAPAGIIFNPDDYGRMKMELESMGLNVVFGEYVKERYGYFSGTDQQRARDLNRFFENPDIDGIIAIRGGWGCARILPYLDFDMIARNPKVYCGFSDNTTLHMAFMSYCGFTSFHGPNGASEWTDLTKESFKSVIMRGEKSEYISNSKVTTLFPGVAEGNLMGGNLTILTTSLGTDYQPDTTGSILFVEDIGEPPYKIDRMLTHLKHAGMLDEIKGFIFGKCTNCVATGSNNFKLIEVLMQHLRPLNIPAMMGVDISHDPDNFTVPIGIKARMDAEKGTFKLLEKAVID
jgi:muramoyltetrapeptide carboxypeptidase